MAASLLLFTRRPKVSSRTRPAPAATRKLAPAETREERKDYSTALTRKAHAVVIPLGV
ncbi:MAG TPA: hypothetical protein VJ842_03710 [Pyrinomonadaceae bacterium]|nr:hypothetical protein [Pyrinomonadaceae bacterium]